MNGRFARPWLAVFAAVLLSGCQLFRGGPPPDVPEALRHPDGPPLQRVDMATAEARLRDAAAEYIRRAEQNQEAAAQQLQYKSPYYFREYSVFPGGVEDIRIDIQETDARTTPYTATVEVDRVRYATRLHRLADTARVDDIHFRDTGTERISYEFRNNRWLRTGSLFVARETEQRINGEWRTMPQRAQRTIPGQEEAARGWFRRTVEAITGR